MLFIQYPPCSTCQKAKKWLDTHGISYTDRHIKEQNPTYEELKAWYEASGLPLKRFFNTSGLLYKSMNLKEKLPAMTEEEQLRLLATDGMLVKRPIVIKDGLVLTASRKRTGHPDSFNVRRRKTKIHLAKYTKMRYHSVSYFGR